MKFTIDNSFINSLPKDDNEINFPRQVLNANYSLVKPIIPTQAKLIATSKEVAFLLGLSKDDIDSKQFSEVFSGKTIYPNTTPFAMNYGGHQFGHWAGQLGDGRAINLFEILNSSKRWMLQLKGAGKTPYSRTADGLAVLRSSIREYLCSEAMHHLGVPTTRALALFSSGDKVLRDVMYNGNPAYEQGAIVCRVAPTFIRFGNFQIHASRNEIDLLKKLTDYTIKHFFPEINIQSKTVYVDFFKRVSELTLEMIIHWQRVGFVHGVMNTDNMSILGLTIDYGPYGWLDDFNPEWTPNTTDAQHRRYRYGNQPEIAQWNLMQLANALFPLVNEPEPFIEILKQYGIDFELKKLAMMQGKLGLNLNMDEDISLVEELEKLLQLEETDMTIFFRNLANFNKHQNSFENFKQIEYAFYNKIISDKNKEHWLAWIGKYIERLSAEHLLDNERKDAMNKLNPKYVLRNYMAQLAIEDAEKGHYSLLLEMEELLKAPYNEQPDKQKWFAKRPDWAKDKIGCSKLSCSS